MNYETCISRISTDFVLKFGYAVQLFLFAMKVIAPLEICMPILRHDFMTTPVILVYHKLAKDLVILVTLCIFWINCYLEIEFP